MCHNKKLRLNNFRDRQFKIHMKKKPTRINRKILERKSKEVLSDVGSVIQIVSHLFIHK